jgi:hypothetical protein
VHCVDQGVESMRKILTLLPVLLAAGGLLTGCGGGGPDAGTPLYTPLATTDDTSGLADVSTAKATQKSMSIAAEDYGLNWGINNESTSVTVMVADTAGNPLPKGTKVQFTTEGGQIESYCTIGTSTGTSGLASGSSGCSVKFFTANPRPQDGKITITAWLVGEEAYKDLNGNGRYDSGEPFYESGQMFRDDNEDDEYTPGVDEIVVSGVKGENSVGIGTSACHQDAAAEPTVTPLSVPNTCDGVWGKTLVRALITFGVSDPRNGNLKLDEVVDGTDHYVEVYTLAPDGTSHVRAPSGTKIDLTSTDSGCAPTASPSEVPVTGADSTFHKLTFTGCASNAPVNVKVSYDIYSESIDLNAP